MTPRPTQPVRRPRAAAPPATGTAAAQPTEAGRAAPAGEAGTAATAARTARGGAAPGPSAAPTGPAAADPCVTAAGRRRPVAPTRPANAGVRTSTSTDADGSSTPGSGRLAAGAAAARSSLRAATRRGSEARTATGSGVPVEVDPTLPVAVPGAPTAGASAGGPTGVRRAGSAPPRTPALHALYRARVSTGSVRRFADRARRRRWLTWRPLAVVAGLVTLLVLAGWVVWFSPLLSAREVRLVGAQRVTQDEVDAAVAAQLGRPLSRLDADAVRERLETLPEVRSVQVLRVWPSTVEVRVTERRPVAAVPDGSAFSLVDAAGVQVEQVAAPPAGLPVVSAETVAAGDAALLAAARVLEALPPALGSQVTATTASTPDSVVLTLASGAQVVWGSEEESARKAAVLQVLLATAAAVYDVSAPGTPVTR